MRFTVIFWNVYTFEGDISLCLSCLSLENAHNLTDIEVNKIFYDTSLFTNQPEVHKYVLLKNETITFLL
jgi:hypothetical protein